MEIALRNCKYNENITNGKTKCRFFYLFTEAPIFREFIIQLSEVVKKLKEVIAQHPLRSSGFVIPMYII